MWMNSKLYRLTKLNKRCLFTLRNKLLWRNYHGIPFVDIYNNITGNILTKEAIEKLKKKHPGIEKLDKGQLKCTLKILEKFGITAEVACQDPHVFVMNPLTMENYAEILRECAFNNIYPAHIIKYHTLVKSHTIAKLKKNKLLSEDLKLEEVLLSCFKEWTPNEKIQSFSDVNTNIVTIRMHILQMFLKWKLGVTPEEFAKYCRNYLPFRHRPFSDMLQAIAIAQNDINFDTAAIRRNGFLISSDPVNTKLILEKVKSLASLDIREVIRLEPAVIKNNYNAILEIKHLLEEYEISEEAQKKCLKVYCMSSSTVKERLDELRSLKEYQVLKTNPRALYMVVHKRKVMNRLEEIHTAKKQCYSLNLLISSRQVFKDYIDSFGSKVNGRDLATLISSSLSIRTPGSLIRSNPGTKLVQLRLKRHKFWLHTALDVIDENIQMLKEKFSDDVIFNNCQLLLYPASEIENYLQQILKMRCGGYRNISCSHVDMPHNLDYTQLSDNQILSLILYEIEKKFHFSGDGIWAKQESKAEQVS